MFLGAAVALVAFHAAAQVTAGHPGAYADTIAVAKKDGKVVIYSTTDAASASPLIKVFQAFYPGISVECNDMNSTQIYNRFICERAALGNLGPGHLGERLPHQLSGGQQQRVAIARAFVYKPPVIPMDEPLSNIDAKPREEARAWLRELILKMRLSALVVTHDQNEAMAMSDRILLLNNGVIEQQGAPQELYGQPDTLFVADFMGSNNRIEGAVVERHDGAAKIAGDGWQLWGQTRGPRTDAAKATGMVRLERVRLAAGERDNIVKLPFATSTFLGDRWEYLFHRSDLRLRACGATSRAPGEQWLEIPRESPWIF